MEHLLSRCLLNVFKPTVETRSLNWLYSTGERIKRIFWRFRASSSVSAFIHCDKEFLNEVKSGTLSTEHVSGSWSMIGIPIFLENKERKNVKALEGFEPPMRESKSRVLTATLQSHAENLARVLLSLISWSKYMTIHFTAVDKYPSMLSASKIC